MPSSTPNQGRVVAVTGACTYLGGELLRRLEEDPRYSRVYALDIRPPAQVGAKVDFIKVDLTQPTVDGELAPRLALRLRHGPRRAAGPALRQGASRGRGVRVALRADPRAERLEHVHAVLLAAGRARDDGPRSADAVRPRAGCGVGAAEGRRLARARRVQHHRQGRAALHHRAGAARPRAAARAADRVAAVHEGTVGDAAGRLAAELPRFPALSLRRRRRTCTPRDRLRTQTLDQAHDPRLPRHRARGWSHRRGKGHGLMTDDEDPVIGDGEEDWYGDADPRVPDASPWPNRDLAFLDEPPPQPEPLPRNPEAELRELERRVEQARTPVYFDLAKRLPLEGVWRRWRSLAMWGRSDVVDDFGRDPRATARWEWLFEFLYSKWFRVQAFGIDNIPAKGRALLVANHAGTLPYDSAMVMHAVRRDHPARLDERAH